MRVKSSWHKDRERDARETASVLAFNTWKAALTCIQDMEDEGFVIGSPEQHFQVAMELVAFLVQGADRYAHQQGMEDEARAALIKALGLGLVKIVAENQWDILGKGDHLDANLALLNTRLADYAELTFTEEGPGYSALRFLGERISSGLDEAHRKWVLEQVVEIEGPSLWGYLTKALKNQIA